MINNNIYAELRVVIDNNKKVYSKINGDISSLIFMHNAALHEILKLLEKELKDEGIDFFKDVMLSTYSELIEADGAVERIKLLNQR
ncbi:MAG: hypothetical protein MSA07_00650 [Mucispirillum sp.]|nr:hypothetical protein [Mucispirillum sp.]